MKEWQGFNEAGGGGVLGGQVPRLYGGTIFGGVWLTWCIWQFIEHKCSGFFWHICGSLEDTQHSLIWSRIRPQVWTRVL